MHQQSSRTEQPCTAADFDPYQWEENGPKQRAAIIARVRNRPPNGISAYHDQMPLRARRTGRWRPLIVSALRDGAPSVSCAACAEVVESLADLDRQAEDGEESLLEIDHIVALSMGGEHAIRNMQLLCVRCHRRKTTAERRAT